MKKRFTVRASKHATPKKRVVAALEDDMDLGYEGDVDNVDLGFGDKLDDVADTVDDIQDTLDDVDEDEPNIDVENNIDDHYIAECEKCHGIFISATVESDQDIRKVTGECPLCQEETDQYLKWIIRKVEHQVAPEPDHIQERLGME